MLGISAPFFFRGDDTRPSRRCRVLSAPGGVMTPASERAERAVSFILTPPNKMDPPSKRQKSESKDGSKPDNLTLQSGFGNEFATEALKVFE